MSSLLFVLGRTPQLSLLELEAYFPTVRRISLHIAMVEDVDASVPYRALFDQLGGCLKVAVVVGKERSIASENLASYIRGDGDKRKTFGISSYDDVFVISASLLQSVKSELETAGGHVRFIAPRTGNDLTSVVVTKQDVNEYIIAKRDQDYLIARTVGVQSFAAWSYRDYGRPFADAKSGMLPPKVARMVVNIAMPRVLPRAFPHEHPQEDPFVGPPLPASPATLILLDPFCGMGTIVAEALLTGWKVIGSDQSEEVVGKATKNLEWLVGLTPSGRQLFVSDATHISEHVPTESVDAIVTEPFMGSTGFTEVKNTIKGLEKLYIGCLKDWHNVLKPGGKVVIALPEYAIGHRTFFVKKVIDKCENLGYTVLAGPIEYSRPQAVVRRKFFVLQKNVHS